MDLANQNYVSAEDWVEVTHQVVHLFSNRSRDSKAFVSFAHDPMSDAFCMFGSHEFLIKKALTVFLLKLIYLGLVVGPLVSREEFAGAKLVESGLLSTRKLIFRD